MAKKEIDFLGKTVVFDWDDATGKIRDITYKDESVLGPMKNGNVLLYHEGKEFKFSKGDMLLTHASPGCYWYWDGTQWRLRCS